jgi:hypothetical protein
LRERVIADYRDRRIVAGVIASRAKVVAGVSNMLVPTPDAERFRAGCAARVSDAFTGLPLVDYEAGHELAEMRALGFEALGALRIWLPGDGSQ